MKKNYMKPNGVVVAMNLKENIAASIFENTGTYGVVLDATGKYINHSELAYEIKSDVDAYNVFWNYFNAIKNGVDPNCGVDIK